MKSIISSHHKHVLSNANVPTAQPDTCNCRKKPDCPLEGKCIQTNVIYQATVTTETATETYAGLATNFKERFSCTRKLTIHTLLYLRWKRQLLLKIWESCFYHRNWGGHFGLSMLLSKMSVLCPNAFPCGILVRMFGLMFSWEPYIVFLSFSSIVLYSFYNILHRAIPKTNLCKIASCRIIIIIIIIVILCIAKYIISNTYVI